MNVSLLLVILLNLSRCAICLDQKAEHYDFDLGFLMSVYFLLVLDTFMLQLDRHIAQIVPYFELFLCLISFKDVRLSKEGNYTHPFSLLVVEMLSISYYWSFYLFRRVFGEQIYPT